MPNRDKYYKAENSWIRAAQEELQSEIKPQTMKRLGVAQLDGIFVVGTRLESWYQHTYDNKNPILLSSKSRLAFLYALQVHNNCHLGVLAVAAKIRKKFWIVGLRRMLRSIRYKCVKCRTLDEKMN